MISVTNKDIGRFVEYRGGAGERERGRIKSFNDTWIFVVYKCDNQWSRFKEFTGVATDPKDLFYEK